MKPNSIEIGNRVKGIISIRNISRKELASKMKISYNTLTKKLNGKREFGNRDMIKLRDILKLDIQTCGNIFFSTEFLNEKQK